MPYEVKRCSRCRDSKPIEQFRSLNSRICNACLDIWSCAACGKARPAVSFYEKPNGAFSTKCKECHKATSKQGYEASKSNAVRFLYDRVRFRAKNDHIEFTIVEADIVIPENCPITGRKLIAVGEKSHHDDSPSLDRVDPSLGYVPGNVAVMSRRGNVLKGGATAKEHERIAAWMRARGAR